MHVNFDVQHSHVTAFGPNLIACDVSSIGSHACVSIEPEHRLHATYRVRTSLACDVPSPNIACMRRTGSDIAGTSLQHRLQAMYEFRHCLNIAQTSLACDVRVQTSLEHRSNVAHIRRSSPNVADQRRNSPNIDQTSLACDVQFLTSLTGDVQIPNVDVTRRLSDPIACMCPKCILTYEHATKCNPKPLYAT